MNRLESELQRLYGPPSPGQAGQDDGVRAMVVEVAAPAAWDGLSKVWRGVQADLQLPAPAIAASGTDGLQLWFSLQAPVDRQRAADWLERLRAQYLPDLAAGRVRLHPSAGGAHGPAARIPAQAAAGGNWSAFIAPDLAPIFSDTPWLDIEPGIEGQADLLARLQSIPPAGFEAALRSLRPAAPAPAAPPAARAGASDLDPRRFLQQVLNDDTVALALRIEAAKALLKPE